MSKVCRSILRCELRCPIGNCSHYGGQALFVDKSPRGYGLGFETAQPWAQPRYDTLEAADRWQLGEQMHLLSIDTTVTTAVQFCRSGQNLPIPDSVAASAVESAVPASDNNVGQAIRPILVDVKYGTQQSGSLREHDHIKRDAFNTKEWDQTPWACNLAFFSWEH